MELTQQQQVVYVPVPTAEVLVSSPLHYLEKRLYPRFMMLYCIVYMLYLCYIAVNKVQTYDI